MSGPREFGNALVIALVSIGLVAGSISISTVEFAPAATPTQVQDQLPSPAPLTATPSTIPTATLDVTIITATASIVPTITITSTPPANCTIPGGWLQIVVQAGETLDSIALKYRTTSANLQQGNCLPTNSVVSGTVLYVPPVPPSTVASCVPGKAGWVKNYTVKAGDNLYRIGFDHYTTLEDMRRVNCRVGDIIYVGELLWVPNLATRTPPPTSQPANTSTNTPDYSTVTPLPYTLTVAPTNTLEPISTLPVFTIQPSATLQTIP